MAKIIPFKSKAQLEKARREKVWEEWLEWERFEKEVMKCHENKENDNALNFDDPADVKEHFMTQEELNFIEHEERIARKEMMRSKNEEGEKILDISPDEWKWLKEWIDSKK